MAAKANARKANTSDRMVASAVAILSESGPRSLTIDRLLTVSGAPRGSVYYHFPQGRDQIVTTAAQAAADMMTAYFTAVAANHSPADSIDHLTNFWKTQLSKHKFQQGCPILATAVDDSDAPELHDIVNSAYTAWKTLIADVLERSGATPARARSIATLAIAAIEGGVALCKATRSTDPFDDINHELKALIADLDTH